MMRLSIFFASILALGALPSCADIETDQPGAAEPPENTLRQVFPVHASRVLAGAPDTSFVPTEQGFALRPSAEMGAWGGLTAELPTDGEGAIRLVTPSGLSIEVREEGAFGSATRAEQALTYKRAGGTSFWTSAPGGLEEWLTVSPGTRSPETPLAAWEVRGATLRQDGPAVEILDAQGAPRIRVTAPEAYTAQGAPVAARLAVNDAHIELFADGGDEALLVDPIWSALTPMSTPRGDAAGVQVRDQEVVILGGFYGGAGVLSSVEKYDWTTDTWRQAGSLLSRRYGHAAAALDDGTVLVVGGFDGYSPVTFSERYNPATGSSTYVNGIIHPRTDLTVTRVRHDQVLAVGGMTDPYVPTNEVDRYHPVFGWQPAARLKTPRYKHAAVVTHDEWLLVAGGYGGSAHGMLKSAEMYNPYYNEWDSAGSMSVPRYNHSMTLLNDGRVLVAGGQSGLPNGYLTSVDIYDPMSNTWTPVAPMNVAREDHMATRLPDGRVLVAGGRSTDGMPTASAEIYNPATNTWTVTLPMNVARSNFIGALLPNGDVLAANGYVASSERFKLGLPLGASCSSATQCDSGTCENGVCCYRTCQAGVCSACSVTPAAVGSGDLQ